MKKRKGIFGRRREKKLAPHRRDRSAENQHYLKLYRELIGLIKPGVPYEERHDLASHHIREGERLAELAIDSKATVLHLTLKKQWFDLIKSGEKKEEYRAIKPYWDSRLSNRHYDLVKFRNGYGKDAPWLLLECRGICIDKGRCGWGAVPKEDYYVIKLGRIIGPLSARKGIEG